MIANEDVSPSCFWAAFQPIWRDSACAIRRADDARKLLAVKGLLASLQSSARQVAGKPLSALLMVLQVIFSSVAIAAAAAAYAGIQGPAEPPLERFNVDTVADESRNVSMFPLFTSAELPELLDLAPAVEAVATLSPLHELTVRVGEEIFNVRAAYMVGPSYIELPEVALIDGAMFTEADIDSGRQLAAVSVDTAETMFPGDSFIGQTFMLDPFGLEIEITAVYDVVEEFNTVPPSMLLTPNILSGAAFSLAVKGRPGQGSEAREQVLSAITRVYQSELAEFPGPAAERLAIANPSSIVEIPRETVGLDVVIYSLFGLVAALVAGIGIFSLTVVDVVDRQRQLGIRRALGASRSRLAVEAALRNVILSIPSVVAGLLLANALFPLTRSEGMFFVLGSGLEQLTMPAAVTVFVLVVLGAFVLTLLPAWQGMRGAPVEALSEG